MSACKEKQQQLLLLYYEELSDPAKGLLQEHLLNCTDCQQYYAHLDGLGKIFPRQDLPQADDATMAVLRNSIQRQILTGKTSGDNFFRRLLYLAPIVRIALATLLFIVGYFSGRQQQTTPAIFPVENLLTASQVVNTSNSAINPVLANINRVNYDPKSGQVSIRYTTVNHIDLSGSLDDPEVRQLLREALLEENNPAIRLHAVKAVGRLTESPDVTPGPDIIEALTFLVDREQNPGVRLKALQVFRTLLPDPLVKAVILNVLLNEQNVSLRREALQAVTSHPLSEDDINILRRVARRDTNSYIKRAAREAIENVSQPSIPGAGNSSPATTGNQGEQR